MDPASGAQGQPSVVSDRVAELAGKGASVSEGVRAGELPDIAGEVLEAYRAEGDCVLVSAGYLDLAGRVWECTVARGKEVEMCFVEEAQGGSCAVHRVRIDPQIAEGLQDAL